MSKTKIISVFSSTALGEKFGILDLTISFYPALTLQHQKIFQKTFN